MGRGLRLAWAKREPEVVYRAASNSPAAIP